MLILISVLSENRQKVVLYISFSSFPEPGCSEVPYFFGYKTVFFSFQNNPKNGSRSLEFFRKGKTHIIAKFLGTD